VEAVPEARPAVVAARPRDGGDLLVPRELGRVRLGAHGDQRPEQAHAPDRDRAVPGRALDELGARVRGVVDRGRAGAARVRDLPAAVHQRPDEGSAEGLMAIATGDLITERSLAVLRDGQSPSGAFVASPSFRVYRFGWLRDGAFCAHALDRVGHSAASGAWHRWVQEAIDPHRPRGEAVLALRASGESPPGDEMLPARYTLDGAIESEDPVDPWPNFQIDGYGMWLWSLEQHLAGRVPDPDQVRTIELVGRYLAASWRLPCCSCWEEFNGGEHASTLASAS